MVTFISRLISDAAEAKDKITANIKELKKQVKRNIIKFTQQTTLF